MKIKIIKIKILLAGACICFFLSGCMMIPHASGNEKVLVTYASSGYLQYYLRPAKMICTDKDDKAFVLIDFTYQKDGRSYVTDAYVNFTLNCKTDAFISSARFMLTDSAVADLKNLSMLRRSKKEGLLRVTTTLEKERIEEVLQALYDSKALLEITLDDGSVKRFAVTRDLIDRIDEAFSK